MVGAALAYEVARRLTSPNWTLADEHARRVWALERTLHVAVERELQAALLHAPWLLRALSSFYLLGHFVLTGLFLVWLYRRSRPEFARLRDALLLATAVALVVHWGFPTAPPRLANLGVADTLRSLLGVDIGSPGHAALSNPVAAVPSLHAGYAVGIAIALWRIGRVFARTLAIAYPAAVLVTVVATGNHFLVDAVSGGAVVAVAYALQPAKSWLYWRLRRGVEQPGSSPGS
ncbi:MAG: hypothetical protein QOE29_1074 [Gaiellaceae bacterium]|nr:hypothetical protein [Gaiellaceae bacterium]